MHDSEEFDISETVRDLTTIAAPWGREISLRAAVHGSGMRTLKLRIREGRRFTDLDLDDETARALTAALTDWTAGNDGA